MPTLSGACACGLKILSAIDADARTFPSVLWAEFLEAAKEKGAKKWWSCSPELSAILIELDVRFSDRIVDAIDAVYKSRVPLLSHGALPSSRIMERTSPGLLDEPIQQPLRASQPSPSSHAARSRTSSRGSRSSSRAGDC